MPHDFDFSENPGDGMLDKGLYEGRLDEILHRDDKGSYRFDFEIKGKNITEFIPYFTPDGKARIRKWIEIMDENLQPGELKGVENFHFDEAKYVDKWFRVQIGYETYTDDNGEERKAHCIEDIFLLEGPEEEQDKQQQTVPSGQNAPDLESDNEVPWS